MAVVHSLRGVQKLKVVRTEEGQVDGHLQCSVVVDFGAQERLEFEDSLPGVPVNFVLNPQKGVFLADEVQRLMRLGIGSWLQVELRSDRVVQCQRSAYEGRWDVSFRLPLDNGQDCDVSVVVSADTQGEATAAAFVQVREWIGSLDSRPLDEEIAQVLGELDLRLAPRLSCGLALVDSPHTVAAT